MFTGDDLLDVLKALRGGAKSKGARPLDWVPPCLPRLYGDGNWIDFDDAVFQDRLPQPGRACPQFLGSVGEVPLAGRHDVGQLLEFFQAEPFVKWLGHLLSGLAVDLAILMDCWIDWVHSIFIGTRRGMPQKAQAFIEPAAKKRKILRYRS